MKPERLVLLGFGGEESSVRDSRVRVSVEGGVVVVVMVGWKGSVLRSKMSPERRMGRMPEYFSVRIWSDSVFIGMVDGVDLVRGWIVTQSTSLFWGCPITVSRKSIVLLNRPISQLPHVTSMRHTLNHRES